MAVQQKPEHSKCSAINNSSSHLPPPPHVATKVTPGPQAGEVVDFLVVESSAPRSPVFLPA